MTVSKITKPVIYKGHVITVNQIPDGRYVTYVRSMVDVNLTTIAHTLSEAFEKAREMIDKLEAHNE